MSGQPRSLPDKPSLRYLKLEAKRRLAAGEFLSLHEAQLAIAREHDLPSWAALKQQVTGQPSQDSHALGQLTWLISRFRAAGDPGWAAPDDAELSQHFGERFLATVTSARVVSMLQRTAEQLREELDVVDEQPCHVRAQVGGLQFEAAADEAPPHRLTGLLVYPVGARVTDARVAVPPGRASGPVPDSVAAIAETAFTELGLVGLMLAGATAGPDEAPWVVARGWAVLAPGTPEGLGSDELAVPLAPDQPFPAFSITKLITATTVLRLVADGLVGLDEPVNDWLRSVRLADDTVTVRELLSHSGGVDSRLRTFADVVPEFAGLAGPVLACDGQRGEFGYSNAGYAALGQLIADVSGTSFAEAATSLVLGPLQMTGSWFPASTSALAAGAVRGYELEPAGAFSPVPRQICTMPAAGGLWSTGADMLRFALHWQSLLPDALSLEALTPVVGRSNAVGVGLGWRVNTERGLAGHAGGAPGGATSLVLVLGDGLGAVPPGALADRRAHVAMTNRRLPIEPVNGRVLRATA